MQNPPLLILSFTVSPAIYQECVMMMGKRMKHKNMPRSLVTGGLFAAVGAAFLIYIFAYIHTGNPVLVGLSVLLILLGVYNLIYFPLLFEKILLQGAARRYDAMPQLNAPVTLLFFEDCIGEVRAGQENRVQWSAVLAVHREPLYYLLRLTADSGIIIPRTELTQEETRILERLLDTKPLTGRPGLF